MKEEERQITYVIAWKKFITVHTETKNLTPKNLREYLKRLKLDIEIKLIFCIPKDDFMKILDDLI